MYIILWRKTPKIRAFPKTIYILCNFFNLIEMSNSSVTNALKIYFFPSLVTIVAMLIWRDVSELRSDVKSLLAQSNVDKTRIDALQKQLDILNQTILQANPAAPAKQTVNLFPSKEFVLNPEQKKKRYVRYA